jgi:hypothetical protein
VNVQFGQSFTVATVSPVPQESRATAPVPDAENKSRSFASVAEVDVTLKSNTSDNDRQGIEEREVVYERRLENKDQEALRRKDKKDRVVDDQSAQDDTDARAQERAEQQAQDAELVQVRELAQRDREVRAHEQAHQSVGGQYTSGMSLEYERGPDGARYAVAGEVGIDTSRVANDPAATARKAEVIRSAALAPAEPSAQDRRVAAQAQQMALQAQADIAQQQQQEKAAAAQATTEQLDSSANSDKQQASTQDKNPPAQDSANRSAVQTEQDKESQDVAAKVAEDIARYNERLTRIHQQLYEISQLDEKVKAKNLLDTAV